MTQASRVRNRSQPGGIESRVDTASRFLALYVIGSRCCGPATGCLSTSADDGALIITFPRVGTVDQRLEFMADVARALPRERWAHVGELMCTDSIDATAAERRAVFARLTERRARKWTSRMWPSSYPMSFRPSCS